MPFRSGVTASFWIIADANPNIDGSNSQFDIYPSINAGKPISFDTYKVSGDISFSESTNITSKGHKQQLPGGDNYTITASGPHSLTELSTLSLGNRVLLYCALSGSTDIPNNAYNNWYYQLTAFVKGFENTVEANGRISISVTFITDGQNGILTNYGEMVDEYGLPA